MNGRCWVCEISKGEKEKQTHRTQACLVNELMSYAGVVLENWYRLLSCASIVHVREVIWCMELF